MAKIYLHKKLKNLIVALSIVIVIITLLTVLLQVGTFCNEEGLKGGTLYDVISSVPNISVKNPKINEIAMLGSHDAFSDKISTASDPDPGNKGIMSSKFFSALTKGISTRFAKTQELDAKGQLSLGVRYFDIRASIIGGEWWTKHGLLSGKLDEYILQILEFAEEHNGEVIILDFQHVYLAEFTPHELFRHLSSVKRNGKNIYDYIAYKAENYPIGELRYNDVCAGGKTGLVLLFNCEDYDYTFADIESEYKCYYYDRESDVRSLWHSTCVTTKLVREIDKECKLLKTTTTHSDKLRINQTQHTIKADGLYRVIFEWSLLNIADDYNAKLVQNANFNKWLSAMPIFMVDFTTSKKGDFNAKANKMIYDYNVRLCNG